MTALGARVPGCPSAGAPECRGARVPGRPSAGAPECRGARVSGAHGPAESAHASPRHSGSVQVSARA